jgi:hypothetical protein
VIYRTRTVLHNFGSLSRKVQLNKKERVNYKLLTEVHKVNQWEKLALLI